MSVALEGRGLHTGAHARVVLRAEAGEARVRANGAEARVVDLEVVATRRATTVEAPAGAFRLGTVEHLFSAAAGLGLFAGVVFEVDGPELPLLDGGAAEWADALARLAVPPSSPRLRVARPGVLEVMSSRYELEPADAVDVSVRLETGDARLEPEARWEGDAHDYRARIAPARTFAMAHEIEELVRRGLASHVHPASVVVVAPDAIHHAGAPFSADEPARHKLLDLLGDLYLCGGPPVGKLRAVRPGHAPNARAVRAALERGILERT